MFKIISPTGVSVTIPLPEEVVAELKADNYFKVESDSLDDFFANEKPPLRIHKSLESCESCSA